MVVLRVGDGFVELLVRERSVGDRRKITDELLADVGNLSAEYEMALSLDGEHAADARAARLLEIGRALYRWVDGAGGELTRVLNQTTGGLEFEVRGPVRPNADEMADEMTVLRAPWELLANDLGFLAADETRPFAPYRRMGNPSDAGPELDDYRLGIMFMASSPPGPAELDFEAEELAILDAAGGADMDLIVEDSGDPEQLGRQLSRLAHRPPVLHICCHGLNDPEPLMLMEDDEGGLLATPGPRLLRHLAPYVPQLLFVSACLTAAASKGNTNNNETQGDDVETPGRGARDQQVVHSLATALVTSNVPAVLGWGGSVSDEAATLFARELYRGLDRGMKVAHAVSAARSRLLNADESGPASANEASTGWEVLGRRDWHLARLWLGAGGGGPVVKGGARRNRSMLPPFGGTKRLLAAKQEAKLEVATPEMFVGRRRELQRSLAALRRSERKGVLLHGMGRLGKSSLAARIGDRRPDLRFAVVYDAYDAVSVLLAMREALQLAPLTTDEDRAAVGQAEAIIDHGLTTVRDVPEALEGVLLELLNGPCGQVADGCALLLLVDDLEQVLEADESGGRHTVRPDRVPVVRSILRAFARSVGDSRLLVTSRYAFTVPESGRDLVDVVLEPVQLAPFHDAAQKKLSLRQVEGARKAVGVDGLAVRDELLARAQGLARGNPGLHDLLGRKISLNPAVRPAAAAGALDQVASYFEHGDLPEDEEIRAFVENLALDGLIELGGNNGRRLLRALTVFQLPVPAPIIELLAGSGAKGQGRRLCDLGLLDPRQDPVQRKTTSYAVNYLVRGRLEPLDADEQAEAASRVVGPLFEAWGGANGSSERPGHADIELTSLGVLAREADVVRSCAVDAVLEFARHHARPAATLGVAAVSLLETTASGTPLELYGVVASTLASCGEGNAVDSMLERAGSALERAATTEPGSEGVGVYLFELGNRQMRTGRLDEARNTWERFIEHMRDRPREIAVANGRIADVLTIRGDLDEALRIRREEELPVYERIGDVREASNTKSRIADVLWTRGERDESMRLLCEEVLPVFERHGDVRSSAVAKGKIAEILAARGDLDEALRIRREEQVPTFEGLGERRELAMTKGKIADLLEARGEADEALRIRREEELPALECLGDVWAVANTKSRIADVLWTHGELDEVMRIMCEEVLPVFERLGDVRSTAIAKGRIADVLGARGELDEALRLRREGIPVYERLGDLTSVAMSAAKVADLLERRGDAAESLRLRKEQVLPALERLGDVRSIAASRRSLALAHLKCGDAEASRRVQNERLQMNRELGDADEIASTLWDLVQLDFAERRFVEAEPRVTEAYTILDKLDRPDGIVVVGPVFARLSAMSGHRERALAALDRSRQAAEKLGKPELIERIERVRAMISTSPPSPDPPPIGTT